MGYSRDLGNHLKPAAGSVTYRPGKHLLRAVTNPGRPFYGRRRAEFNGRRDDVCSGTSAAVGSMSSGWFLRSDTAPALSRSLERYRVLFDIVFDCWIGSRACASRRQVVKGFCIFDPVLST